jgi:hypothetical protein
VDREALGFDVEVPGEDTSRERVTKDEADAVSLEAVPLRPAPLIGIERCVGSDDIVGDVRRRPPQVDLAVVRQPRA